MRAAIVECDLRACHQILHGAGAEHLARGREGAHARRDVHRDPPDLVLAQLDLTGVKSGADLDALAPQLVANLERAANSARRPVERREYAVAGRAVELAAMVVELGADDRVMSVKDRAPAMITQLHGPIGGSDHVREEHGREDAICVACRPRPGDELLDRVEQGAGLTQIDEPIRSRQLDELCSSDVLSEVAAMVDREEPESRR